MRDLFQKFSNMEAKLSEHFKREVVVGISAANLFVSKTREKFESIAVLSILCADTPMLS